MSDAPRRFPNLAPDAWVALERFTAQAFGVVPIHVALTPEGRPDPAVTARLRAELAGRDALFTLGPDGVLSVVPENVGGVRLNHTVAAAGRDVVAAGRLTFDPDGRVVGWSNESGHYRPTPDTLDAVTHLLRTAGLLAGVPAPPPPVC